MQIQTHKVSKAGLAHKSLYTQSKTCLRKMPAAPPRPRLCPAAFGNEIDYAMLNKIYGPPPEGPQVRYSPAQCMGANWSASGVTTQINGSQVTASYPLTGSAPVFLRIVITENTN
jgi:hypothetical protein